MSLPYFSITFSIIFFVFVLILSRCTLSIHKPESRLSDIVDLSHFLTIRSVLNDLSTVYAVAGRVKIISKASRTAILNLVRGNSAANSSLHSSDGVVNKFL